MDSIISFLGQVPEGWEYLEYVARIIILLLGIRLTADVIKVMLSQMMGLGR